MTLGTMRNTVAGTAAAGAAGMMMMSASVVAMAALGGIAAGALGYYAVQKLARRTAGLPHSKGAHQVDGSDATASFNAGIADENTVPDGPGFGR